MSNHAMNDLVFSEHVGVGLLCGVSNNRNTTVRIVVYWGHKAESDIDDEDEKRKTAEWKGEGRRAVEQGQAAPTCWAHAETLHQGAKKTGRRVGW